MRQAARKVRGARVIWDETDIIFPYHLSVHPDPCRFKNAEKPGERDTQHMCYIHREYLFVPETEPVVGDDDIRFYLVYKTFQAEMFFYRYYKKVRKM